MTAVTVRTPAKINLALAVGPPRPDGFHELASIYHAVGLFDEVTAAPARRITVTVEGEGARFVPVDGTNLAVRAAQLLANRYDVRAGAKLRISKGIPVAGGLAGGSSDAAAALVACDALWDLRLSRTQLLTLAAELGSDVPFCLHGATALGSGHGEIVTPVLARGSYAWVLALSAQGLSTPRVYAELDRQRGDAGVHAPGVPDSLLAALRAGDIAGVGAALTNDLQPVAVRLRPALRRVLRAGADHGALGSLVSGSGPSCVFLAQDREHADELAAKLTADESCDDVRVAHGPVPGARLV